jgi:hypothetical protein
LEQATEIVSPQYLFNVGREYSLTGKQCKGAFHPKINFFIGNDAILVLFGSGNLTTMGQGKNHEIFTGLWLDKDNLDHVELVKECWSYLTKHIANCSEYDRNRILYEIPQNCTFLNGDFHVKPHEYWELDKTLNAALLYNDNTSILSQMMNIIPSEEVTKITVVSPFFDENGSTLLLLTELCPKAKIDVIMQKTCSLPPIKLKENNNIHFYDFDDTDRGRQKFLNDYTRTLHAKLFHFKTKEMEYCVVGSANATEAGIGTMHKRGINDEFCILYSSSKRHFLSELGLNKKELLNIKLKEMVRRSSDGKNNVSPMRKYRILSAEYCDGKITIYTDSTISNDFLITIDSGYNQYSGSFELVEKSLCSIPYDLGNRTGMCYFTDNIGNIVSNRCFINSPDYLNQTNPSFATRSLNSAISRIENIGFDGLEIVELLNEIIIECVEDVNSCTRNPRGTNSNHPLNVNLPSIKYNPEYDNDDLQISRTCQFDRTSKLFDCIEDTMRRKLRLINEDIINEEESASSETSNERIETSDNRIFVHENSTKIQSLDYPNEAKKIVQSYIRYVKKRMEYIRATGQNAILADDLNIFSLAMFISTKLAFLDRLSYVFEGNGMYKSARQKSYFNELDMVMHSDALEALENFSYFCKKNKLPQIISNDFQKKIHRSLKYAVLYATMFYKFASIDDSKVYGQRILSNLKSLFCLLAIPDKDRIKEELSILSVSNNYVFRIKHVDNLLAKVEQV